MSLKIVSISDTHGYHRDIKKIPDGDVLVHAGDISLNGELNILFDFAEWIRDLPHKHKLVIAGNHDRTLENIGKLRNEILAKFKACGITYLQDSGITIDSHKFWGSPYTPFYHNWHFMLPRGEVLAKKWAEIPLDTNVLITHGPVYGILDKAPRGLFEFEHAGCEQLLARIKQLPDLKLHLCGHIHENHSIHEEFGIKFVNSAICTGSYQPTNLPHEIEI